MLTFLGWKVLHQSDNMLGCGYLTDDVDEAVTFLLAKNIPALFDTPRHRPEFSIGPDDTYYQVMFETPDKILIEIVYIGPK